MTSPALGTSLMLNFARAHKNQDTRSETPFTPLYEITFNNIINEGNLSFHRVLEKFAKKKPQANEIDYGKWWRLASRLHFHSQWRRNVMGFVEVETVLFSANGTKRRDGITNLSCIVAL